MMMARETIVFRKSLNNRVFLDILSFFPISEIFEGVKHGTYLPSHREKADGRQQRFPCEQQDQASLPAESAAASYLCRVGKSLGLPAPVQRWPTHHRQARHRCRPGRYARPWRKSLTSTVKESSWLPRAATKSNWSRLQVRVTSTPRPRTSAPCRKKWRS